MMDHPNPCEPEADDAAKSDHANAMNWLDETESLFPVDPVPGLCKYKICHMRATGHKLIAAVRLARSELRAALDQAEIMEPEIAGRLGRRMGRLDRGNVEGKA